LLVLMGRIACVAVNIWNAGNGLVILPGDWPNEILRGLK